MASARWTGALASAADLTAVRRRRRASLRSTLLVLVASVLLAVCGLSSLGVVQRVTDARGAARDAVARVAAIQTALRGQTSLAGLPRTATLSAINGDLDALSGDLARLRADLLVDQVPASVPTTASLRHALALAADLVRAGKAGVDAGLAVVPGLSGALSGALGGPAGPGGAAAPPPLTAADIGRATADMAVVQAALAQAVVERSQVRDADLRMLGQAGLVADLGKFDALAAAAPPYLKTANTVLAGLPGLLGIAKPTRFLLFELDSDELRPTGGFLGNYAVLTFTGGRLAGGVHLHDIYTLDCPGGACPYNPTPAQFGWMQANQTNFALRDSNLDPDYPTSARLAERLFVQEGGQTVDGVISVTPAVVENVLRVTGAITVAPFGRSVTATNLQEVIHYYHIVAGNGLPDGVTGQSYDTSNRKAFDAAFGDALLKALAALPEAKRGQLTTLVWKALATRDVQVYVNDPHVEALLNAHGLDSSVQAPAGDSAFVVDANVGVSYSNADVTERLNDHVTLDAAGTATHDLTITYTYPVVWHLYTSVYRGPWRYIDFVRVIVPARARLVQMDGCDASPTTEAGHGAFGCTLTLWQSGSAQVRFRWTVAHAAGAAGGHTRYDLLLQKQPGTHVSANVTIAGPGGHPLAHPVAPPLVAAGAAAATYAARLVTDQELVVTY